MKCRVVYKPDKTVAVIKLGAKSKLSAKEGLEKTMKHHRWEGLPFDDIDTSKLPKSREDRGAWEGEKGKGVTVNQVKAKQIRDARGE